jgi:hypothetical protein
VRIVRPRRLIELFITILDYEIVDVEILQVKAPLKGHLECKFSLNRMIERLNWLHSQFDSVYHILLLILT